MFNSVWCITFKSSKYEVPKYPGRLKSWQKWRAKEAKSKSIWKSKSVDLRLDFTSTIHYHHDLVIIKPMGLIEVQIIKYLQIVSKSSFLTVLLTRNHKVLHHQPKNHWKKAKMLNLLKSSIVIGWDLFDS